MRHYEIDPASAARLIALLPEPKPDLQVTADNLLALVFADGRVLVLSGTSDIVATFAERLIALKQFYLREPLLFADLIGQSAGAGQDPRIMRELAEHMRDLGHDWVVDTLPQPRIDRETLPPAQPFHSAETFRLMAKAGADHNQLLTPFVSGHVGQALPHLGSLPGEDFLFRTDRYTMFDGDLVGEEYLTLMMKAGVGAGLDHLPRLPGDDRILGYAIPSPLDDPGRRHDDPRPNQGGTAKDDAYTMLEDGNLAGNLLDNDTTPAGFRDLRIVTPPATGALTLDAAGNFTYTPPAHFSGTVTAEVTYKDIGSGLDKTTTVTIVVQPVTDAPTLSVPPAPILTPEDTPVALTGLNTALVDTDGSETIAIRLTGVPNGASFGGAGTDLGGGIWAFTAAEIAAGLIFTPPLHRHGDFTFTLVSTTTETASGVSETRSGDITVRVAPVADPAIVPSGSSSGLEDGPLSLGPNIVYTLVDTDGSEQVSITITGFPASATPSLAASGTAMVTPVATGFTITAANAADLRATLDSLSVTHGAHTDADYTLSVAVTTTEPNGSTQTVTASHAVTLAAVADTPNVNVGAGAFTGSEDTPVILAGVSAALVDRDGSESGVFIIEQTGGPAGGRFLDGLGNPVGTDLGGGRWQFTEAQFAGLRFDPPANTTGIFAFTLSGTATESAPNGGQVSLLTANDSKTFTVTISGAADTPSVTAGASIGNEDNAILFGNAVTITLNDTDGSESLIKVTVSGVPSSGLGWNTGLPGSVIETTPGTWEVTAATEADLRALFATLSVQPSANRDDDYVLSIVATVQDSDGSQASNLPVNHTITVRAVADDPVLSGSASGNEDQTIAVPVTVGPADTDGSETITKVVVTAPAGITLGWNTGLAGTVNALGGNAYEFTGTQAQIQGLMASLTVRAPNHGDADFSLSIDVTATETNPVGGQVAVLNAVKSFSVPVTITAVADAPLITVATISGNEDSVIGFGDKITWTKPDNDGSEWVSQVTLSAFPSNSWVVAWSADPAVSVTGTPATGFTLSISAQADEAKLRAVLDSFSVTPPAHSDADPTLQVTVTTQDHDGSSATAGPVAVPITVTAVADTPMPSATTASGEEDTFITFGDKISFGKVDTDGSERVSRVEITTADAHGGFTWTPVAGVSVSAIAGGYAITGANEADIRSVLDSFALRGASNSDADVSLTIKVQTTDNDGSVSSYGSTTQLVAIDADATNDQVTPVVAAISGNEDSVIGFGDKITWTKPDNDGSEWVSQVTLSAFPSNSWVVAWSADPAVSVTGTPATGFTLSISAQADEAKLRAVLDSFSVTPPAHSDADPTIKVQLTTTDRDGSTATGPQIDVPIIVRAVADAPSASGVTLSMDEDVPISLFGIAAGFPGDVSDGSESKSVTISGLPAGAVLTWNTGLPGTVTGSGTGPYTFSGTPGQIQALLDTVMFDPPAQLHGTFVLTLAATATETNPTGGQIAVATATATAPITITIGGILDNVTIVSGSTTRNEDQTIPFGNDLNIALADLDGSQSLSVTLSGLPASIASLTHTPIAGVSVSNLGGGTWTISGSHGGDVYTVLKSLVIPAVPNGDANYTVNISATTTETSTGATMTATGTHQVNVRAVADAPTVSGSSTVNEDVAINFGNDIVLTKTDTDGSEHLTQVVLAGFGALVPTYTAQSFGGATASIVSGGGAYTITASGGSFADRETAIRNTVKTFTLTPGLHNGNDINLTVTATSTETTPTEAGDIAVVNASNAGYTFNINVVPVADAPTVTAPGIASPFNVEEDIRAQITGLAVNLVDSDGSETLSVRITGVSTLTGTGFFNAATGGSAVGTNLGGGIWSFTKAQIDAGIWFQPPTNRNGTFTMTLQGTATETENSSTASNSAQFRVIVDSQADQPTISGSSTVNEDTAITFGTNIAVTKVDTDGTESITAVTLSGFPGGVTPTYTPGTSGAATASVAFAAGVYTITASGGTAAQRETAILNTKNSFALTPALNNDYGTSNIVLNVSATTTDSDGSTATRNATHTITVRAVADAPTANAPGSVTAANEDGPIALTGLNLSVGASSDADGSETLSAVLTNLPLGSTISLISGNLPSGATLTSSGGGATWTIAANSQADLNTILANIQLTPPSNYSGSISGQLQAISTEAAIGGEVATKTATATANFSLNVRGVADSPTLLVQDSGGYEDGDAQRSGVIDDAVRLNINYRLNDSDGSETIRIQIEDVPTGAYFVDAGGLPVGTNLGGGVWRFDGALADNIRIVPPPNSNADFSLRVTAIAIENPLNVATGFEQAASATLTLNVAVTGVADTPNLAVNPVVATEDQPILLSSAINFGASGLTDTDGSETLSYVLIGLPAGVLPNDGTNPIGSYLGNGEWQLTAAEMAVARIPAPANYSGSYLPGLKIRAVAQENDGDQTSVERSISITINPVADGLTGWAPGVTVNEDHDIPLASVSGLANRIDGTIVTGPGMGSNPAETIEYYTFDLTNIIANASIGGTVADVNSFITSYITGTFTRSGNIITVQAADLAGVAFKKEAFVNSNVDFAIPVTAFVRDGTATRTDNGSFSVTIDGVADIPSAFASSATVTVGTPASVSLSGNRNDTDAALGRSNSEDLYFIVSGLTSNPNAKLAFFDSSNQIVGLNNGDGTWLLRPSELAGLRIAGALLNGVLTTQMINLTLTAIVVENDSGSSASSAAGIPATFTITLNPPTGGSGTAPLPPQITVTPMAANEDGQVVITVNAQPGAGDTTSPSVAVMISNLPAGATITGATYNPISGKWVATAADINAGNVRVTPPANFAGTMNLTIEGVATNVYLQEATTGAQTVGITIAPVADGVAISASPAAGIEDLPVALNLSVALRDTDPASAETLVAPIVVRLSDAAATLSAGTLVSPGVYHLTSAQLSGLTLTSAPNRHGTITVTVEATSRDIDNSTRMDSHAFAVSIGADADAPLVTAANATGLENTSIALSGLSASLVDTDGSELLAVKVTGIPAGATLSHGSNNGDGSWTVAVGDLASLAILPPLGFSGVMNLALQAFALERSNGDEATAIAPFSVSVNPVGGPVFSNALDLSVAANDMVQVDLRLISTDTTGLAPNENPPETVRVEFSNVPTGASFLALGGTITNAGNTWTFEGTLAHAASLQFVAPNAPGLHLISVKTWGVDNGAVASSFLSDDFQVTVTGSATTPATFNGTTGNDTYTGGTGNDTINGNNGNDTLNGGAGHDTIDGGAGNDIMAGGTGNDIYIVDSASDSVTEAANAGIDLVRTTLGTYTLTANVENLTYIGASTFTGTGNGLDNTITGGSQADILNGGAGSDTLIGNGGVDRLTGGTGIDTLTGGTGADTFVWQAGDAGTGADFITDFNLGQGDKLDIKALLSGFVDGTSVLSDFVRFQESGGNTLVSIAPSGGGAFSAQVAVLNGVTGLNADLMKASGNLIVT